MFKLYRVNKTKVINTIEYEDVAKSYAWDKKDTRGTFPAHLWINSLFDFLYYGLSTKEIEEKYTQFMKTIKRPTNYMYFNSLLKKMLISNNQNTKLIQSTYSDKELIE